MAGSSRTIYGPNPAAFNAATGNLLATGEEVLSRDLALSGGLVTTSQVLRLSHFTARKTETTTQVRVPSGTTAAAATPTLARIGLYQIASDGAGTLVAATANDTALFAAANTAYTRSWSASFAKVAGQRYALGVLVVTAATAPTLTGIATGSAPATTAEHAMAPRLAGSLGSQADLPASFTDAALGSSSSRLYGVVLP